MYEKILKLCQEKGITISHLAQQVGVSKTSASGWKKGSTPSPKTVKAMADYFNVEVSYFYGDINIANADNGSIAVNGDKNNVAPRYGEIESEIIKLLKTMNLKQKNELLAKAYELTEKERGIFMTQYKWD